MGGVGSGWKRGVKRGPYNTRQKRLEVARLAAQEERDFLAWVEQEKSREAARLAEEAELAPKRAAIRRIRANERLRLRRAELRAAGLWHAKYYPEPSGSSTPRWRRFRARQIRRNNMIKGFTDAVIAEAKKRLRAARRAAKRSAMGLPPPKTNREHVRDWRERRKALPPKPLQPWQGENMSFESAIEFVRRNMPDQNPISYTAMVERACRQKNLNLNPFTLRVGGVREAEQAKLRGVSAKGEK